MTQSEWDQLVNAQRLASNYSHACGAALQKLIYEYGKLVGKKDDNK